MTRRASIVVPAFNAADVISVTLRSIVEQIGPDDEVLVVDDGSTDATFRVVESFEDDRVDAIRIDPSGGPARPRNEGIRRARGRYVFLCDADDHFLPGKIEATVAAFEAHPDAGMVFTNFRCVDERGRVVVERFLDSYEVMRGLDPTDTAPVRLDPPDACRCLARQNFVGTSGVALRRETVDTIGRFDESLPNGEDRDLWFRITRRLPIVYLPTPYHDYVLSPDGISHRRIHATAPSRIAVLERQLADPVDTRFEADIRALIGSNHQGMAYESFLDGEMARARREIARAWTYRPNRHLVRMYMLSLLGARGVRLLRGARDRLTRR